MSAKDRVHYVVSNQLSLQGPQSSLSTMLVSLISGTFGLIKIIIPIVDYVLYRIAKATLYVAIKVGNKVAEAKKEHKSTQQVYSSIAPDVKALVSEFMAGVKADPSKAAWEQSKFQKALVTRLKELSQEYDLDMNVHKVAQEIVKNQAKALQVVIKKAKAKQGKSGRLTRDEIMSTRDMTRITEDLAKTLDEEHASGRYRRI